MSATTGPPYIGPRPFQRADQRWFAGRKPESDVVADFWQSNSLTVLDGPAASGKTSLVQAGAIPLVATSRAEVLPPASVSAGATFPAAALPGQNPYSHALLRSWTPGESPAAWPA